MILLFKAGRDGWAGQPPGKRPPSQRRAAVHKFNRAKNKKTRLINSRVESLIV